MFEYNLLKNNPSSKGCLLAIITVFCFISGLGFLLLFLKIGYIECIIGTFVSFLIFFIILSNPQLAGVYNSYDKIIFDEDGACIILTRTEEQTASFIPVSKLGKVKLKQFRDYDMLRLKEIARPAYTTLFFRQGEGRNFYELIINSKAYAPKFDFIVKILILLIAACILYLVYNRYF